MNPLLNEFIDFTLVHGGVWVLTILIRKQNFIVFRSILISYQGMKRLGIYPFKFSYNPYRIFRTHYLKVVFNTFNFYFLKFISSSYSSFFRLYFFFKFRALKFCFYIIIFSYLFFVTKIWSSLFATFFWK